MEAASTEEKDTRIKIGFLAADWEKWRHDKIIQRHPNHQYEGVRIQYTSLWAKFIVNNGAQAFIALSDGQNRTLGAWKEGDIFMPATWNAPAKHKRGSLFDKNPMKCFGEFGVKRMDQL